MGPAERAEQVAVTTLLNCWRREVEAGTPGDDGVVVVPLERLGVEVVAEVGYDSVIGRHAYRLPVRLATGTCPALDAVTLAALLGREFALRGEGSADLAGFVGAVADSTGNLARFLGGPVGEPSGLPFLRAEQSLRTGHPLHPAAKSRQPMTVEERDATAPELCAAFTLH